MSFPRAPALAFALLFEVAVGLAVPVSAAAKAPACPADIGLANLLAHSEIVLIGTMDVTGLRLNEDASTSRPYYIDIPVRVQNVLKGEQGSLSTLRYFVKESGHKASSALLLGLSGQPVLLFLIRGDGNESELYLAGYTPDALTPASASAAAAVRAEVSRQAQISTSHRADRSLPHYAQVEALIARLGEVRGNEQQAVFNEPEALGPPAVPAIIAQMDERRSLRTPAITLANHAPDAFEGQRHYGPKLVVDGLAAVLNQITSESFGFIYNGSFDGQRDATVAGWRVYAADLKCNENK